uniref:Transposase, MuDR, MULE transposase domain protein n=1 Tax=Tanacetum cinerariifolium TaxID=118510 RepID=A0A6L2LLN2_TANCI|nr:transposase, MuDR, MULE transposase domain protein [Tanacetum cinerariifolium]GEU73506.1 transposase, MuDR, MULE transposase domain protein [Tanacetum cinerariifolium]
MSTQEYMQKVVEDVGEDAEFNSGAWVSATNYVIAFGGTVTGCLGDIDNFLKKGKLKQVVAIVKSCYPNALRDLNVTLKDVSERVGLLINSPGGSSTTTFSQATSSSPSLSPTPSTTPIYYGVSSTNRECLNCKHLLGRIKVLQATFEMYRHPEQHTLNSAVLLHDLNNDMEKLILE